MKYQNYLKSLTCSNVNEVSCGEQQPLLLLPKHAKKQIAETTMGMERLDWRKEEGSGQGTEQMGGARMKAKANS